jgi:hypothetical protein
MSDPQVTEPTEPVVDPNALAQVDTSLAIEPKAGPSLEPIPPPAGKPWYLERISQESARAEAVAAKLATAERRAAEAEALAERLRAGNDSPTRQEPPSTRQEPDRQAEIRREAAAMRLAEDSMEVRNRGIAEYGASFVESLGILQAVGAVTDDFVSDVLAVDKSNAHKIFDTIAKDPERAATLAAMSSRQRIAELTRMSVAQTTPKADPEPTQAATLPKFTSKAPAPPPRIEPTASQVVDWRSDKASDDEFTRGFEEMMKKRTARR